MARDELTHLEEWVTPLVAKLSAPGRKALSRLIGRDLRRSQAQRIAAQKEPDGTPFAARRPGRDLRSKRGSIRQRKAAMFAKLRTARWLKVMANENEAAVGFTGRAERIARVHQEGLRDRVSPQGPEVRYARRQLLGFSEADRRLITDALLAHLRGV
ncbi:phage virion morphogenesis protein [Luteibacter sp. NPDC031894]|uniref:phage virion morphogenesis protein n=1 Tax=Luteibacter sp. NPDC031894 TaxID=3390572 RepID=UPI003D043111